MLRVRFSTKLILCQEAFSVLILKNFIIKDRKNNQVKIIWKRFEYFKQTQFLYIVWISELKAL